MFFFKSNPFGPYFVKSYSKKVTWNIDEDFKIFSNEPKRFGGPSFQDFKECNNIKNCRCELYEHCIKPLVSVLHNRKW